MKIQTLNCPEIFKIAALYAGVEGLEVETLEMGDLRKPQFRQTSPLGMEPVLIDGDKTHVLWITVLRAIYGELFTCKVCSKCCGVEMMEMLELAVYKVLPSVYSWVNPLKNPNKFRYNKGEIENSKKELKLILTKLNKILVEKTYLGLHEISIADIAMACSFAPAFENLFDVDFRKLFPNVMRWFNTLMHQEKFVKVFGEFKLCEKALEYEPPKKQKKQKQKQPKQEKKENPKDEKPEEEKEKKYDFRVNDYDMDLFKRAYSNEDLKKEVIPKFWTELYDKEKCCIYKCDYKYSSEINIVFMASNLIGGWHQRMDPLRKCAFGSVIITGEQPNLEISGIWIFKGSDMHPMMRDGDDCELYNWERVDTEDEKNRKLVESYLLWEFDDDRKVPDGKIFK